MALFYQKELFVISCCTENDPVRPICAPILFFLFLRKKRIAASGEEKKENFRNRGALPVPPSCNSSFAQFWLPAPGHLSAGNYVPHAILMMAGR